MVIHICNENPSCAMDESVDDIHCTLWSLSIIDEMLEAHGDSYLKRQTIITITQYCSIEERGEGSTLGGAQ